MSFYDRDPTVPYWRSNVDVNSLFAAHAQSTRSPIRLSHIWSPANTSAKTRGDPPAELPRNRAQAWLKFRDVSECSILEQAVMMRGHFELGILSDHTYHWTFTPTHAGGLAIVLPVSDGCRLVDLLAVSRHDHSIWGCLTGAGQYVGSTAAHRKNHRSPIRVYKTPINWLLANCEGILPLAKAFFPQLQQASGIVGDDIEHAWEIAQYVFTDPAQRHFLDYDNADAIALNKVSFEVEA